MKTKTAFFIAFLFLQTRGDAAERWKLQYFYDKDTTTLDLRDLQCPSIRNCVAAGAIIENGKDKSKGTLVMTSDGGEHWALNELKEIPYSLFFLNAERGWMVTERGIWNTADGGKTWNKLKSIKGVERLWFQDENTGWAIGEPKLMLETRDGGKQWKPVVVAGETETATDETFYDSIAVSGTRGVITGRAPGTGLMVETIDAGKLWRPFKISFQGRFNRVRFLNTAEVLGVVEFFGKTSMPSEIFTINLETRNSKEVFHQPERVARDVAVLPDKQVIVAAVDRQGTMNQVPIPSKLRIMQSTSLATWLDEKVDYRAVAMHPIIAVGDSNHVWVATDTGMILKREVVP